MKSVAAVALAAALAWSPGALGAGEDPHGFLREGKQCQRCHVGVPKRGAPRRTLQFQKDLVSLCLDCHWEKDVSALHPVDIRPGFRVPADLPLDDQGTITCVTCHDPHGSYEGEVPYVAESLSRRILSLLTGRSKYRTFYLRHPNDSGQLCLGCHDRDLLASEGFHIREASLIPQYAGSTLCRKCHEEVYREWSKTPHARMTRDARTDPSAVLGDFGAGAPFPREDVIYSLGTHWTQRYVVDKGGKLFVKAPIWSVVQSKWDTSYWIDKPWTQYCQGCHTTGFEMKAQPAFVELGIGCEACHGPGRAHAESSGRADIVNPRRLDAEKREMVCASCHTTGHDRTGQFRYPLGFLPGRDLTRYYRGLLPKPGQDNQTFAGDESYADRSRQWQFWKDTFMDVRGLTCDVCKNFRSASTAGEKPQMTPSAYCLSCHGKSWPDSELHQTHLVREVECHECHVPMVTRGGAEFSVHDHKFFFGRPVANRPVSIRASCAQCHAGAAASGG